MGKQRFTLRIDLATPFGRRVVRSTRKAVRAVAEEWGFSEGAIREIELCFSEALQNAMDHGTGTAAVVHTENEFSDDGLRIVIEDPGAGQGNCEQLKDVFERAEASPPDAEEERGRGLYLIRNLMDDVSIHCMEGGGVRITLFKKRR